MAKERGAHLSHDNDEGQANQAGLLGSQWRAQNCAEYL